MSIRQMFPGSIVKPGFNPLAAPTPTYLYNLFSWGDPSFGKLGLGNNTYYSSPKQVGSLTNWAFLAGGDDYSVAVKTDGTLWAWGRNEDGQLGLGNRTNYSSPKQVGSLTSWSTVDAGYACTAGIKTDGTLWTWGRGTYGTLGLGNTTSYSSPKQVGSLTTWSKIYVASSEAMLAIKTDGTLWSWGLGSNGQLGLGNTTSYSSPKQIGSLTAWLKGAAGGYNAFVIKTDGTIWTWGRASFGSLGLGNLTNYSSPKQIGALTDWAEISNVNGTGGLAVKTNGTLWSWGYNNSGQLGLGNTTNYSSPKQVGALTSWSKPRGFGNSGYAIKTDGTLWSWGRNAEGQLGLNNTTYYSSPKQVGSSTTWNGLAQGGNKFVLVLG
jgi:alpha-tubulin suppressor-like RCC1 family protein